MSNIYGISASGNKPSTIGTTWTVKTWNASTNVQTIAYGNGVFFGGRNTAALGGVRYVRSPESGTITNPSLEGQTNSNQKPSYANGFYIQPTSGGAIRFTTDPAGTWTSKTIANGVQINRVIYMPAYNAYWAVSDTGELYSSTTGLNGTWTLSGITGPKGWADLATDGTNVLLKNKQDAELYYFNGDPQLNSATLVSTGLSAGTYRNIKYHASQGVWTSCNSASVVGYHTGSGITAWSTISSGITGNLTDGDINFVNGRWVIVSTNAGGSSLSVSRSATSSITSAFTAQAAIAVTGTNSSGGSFVTDGNWLVGILGDKLVYTR